MPPFMSASVTTHVRAPGTAPARRAENAPVLGARLKVSSDEAASRAASRLRSGS